MFEDPTFRWYVGLLFTPGFWVGYAVISILVFPWALRKLKKENQNEVEKWKRQALQSLERATRGEAHAEEARWLSSLSMPDRLLATRLLVARIDELDISDRPFIEDCQRIGNPCNVSHVTYRMKAMGEMLKYFDVVEQAKSRNIWLEAFSTAVQVPFGIYASFLVIGGMNLAFDSVFPIK